MANKTDAMKSLSGIDSTNVPQNILALIRKRKASVGDTTKKVNVIEDAKLASSGKGKPSLTKEQRDSMYQSNQPKYEKYIGSIGYERVKNK